MALNQPPLKLCIAEEQEIFRRLYELALAPEFELELLPEMPSHDAIHQAVTRSKPDALIVGVKSLAEQVLEAITELRLAQHHLGIIILLPDFCQRDTALMRRLAVNGSGGLALFLKRSLVRTEQLVHMVTAVCRGQVILDAALTVAMFIDYKQCPLLRQMTTREQEILALLANGYTNPAIARTLLIEVKTVEYYINSMYSKLKSMTDFDTRHPRVEAARLYLQAVGELPQAAEKQ